MFRAFDFDHGQTEYELFACPQCGLARTEPRPTPDLLSASYAPDYYGQKASKFVGVVEYWTRLAARHRASRLVATQGVLGSRLRILDYGCGRGVLLDAFRSLGHDAVGVERSDSPFQGTTGILCGDLSELDLPPGSFDLIVLWHVLEHLDEPAATLRQLHSLLRSDGRLVISVPNFGGQQSRMFRGNWFHLDLPRHLVHFDTGSLSRTMESAGFRILRRHASSPDQSIFGFIQSTFNSIPRFADNHFYGLLRTRRSLADNAKLLVYIAFAALLLLPALLEMAIAGLRREGATLTVTAGKQPA